MHFKGKPEVSTVKFLSTIRPRTIIAGTIAVAVLMFGSAFLELRQSRIELLHLLHEHSTALAEAIERSSANVVLAAEQVERELSERLLNNAFYIAHLDSVGSLSKEYLGRIAAANDIYRINIFDARGRKVLSSHEAEYHPPLTEGTQTPGEMLKPILSGRHATLIMGLKEARFGKGQRYAVAVRRTRPSGGAIVLNLDANELLEFRRRVGIGKLIRDLGDHTGIEYIVLQDYDGIVAATAQVREVSSVLEDSLVATVAERDTVLTRQIEFQGRECFEILKRLTIEGSPVGVLRIGLSLDELRSAEERMKRRMLIMSVVLVVLASLVFTAIAASRKLGLVSRQYAMMQSLTGNILEHMRDAVVTVDGENTVTVFNRQAETMFSVLAKDVIGRRVSELGEVGTGCLGAILEPGEAERTLECTPGVIRTISVSHSSVQKPDGTLESRTVVIKDLTEQRRLEREIRRKDKLTAMGELASGVAHEVRNPLNAISMIAQRYEREFTPRSGAKEYRVLTRVLRKEVDRVNGIIQQFLKFSRPPKLKITAVPAAEFAEHVSTLFKEQAESKEILFFLRNQVKGNLHIDSRQMTQALLNLLQNALDATPRKGSISLQLSPGDGFVALTVTDTGAGIPADKLEKIFDIYFTTKPEGTGMGLAISQQIVAQHHGNIEVQSEVGKGTSFVIRIPLGEPPEEKKSHARTKI